MKTLEIVGTFEGERMRFDNADGSSVVIGQIRLANGSKEIAQQAGVDNPHSPLTIKGEADRSELEYRKTYRFLGTFREYTNQRYRTTEKQFHFRTFIPHVPHDAAGLANYLVSAGRGVGIGPAKAKRLVGSFGCDDVLKVCRTQPEEVSRAASIELHFAKQFAQRLIDQQATENATIEVDRLLTGRGFPKTLCRKAIKEWGNKAAETILKDPYRLMLFRGVGFGLTDKLYIELGKDPLAIDRQALCLWYGIASDNSGNTWIPAAEAVDRLQKTIGSSNIDWKAAIRRGLEFGQIDDEHYGAIASIRSSGREGPLCETGETLWLAEGKHAASERALTKYISGILSESEADYYSVYTDETREELVYLDHAKCHRCHRALTAPQVHVYQGKPYGPTCIEYVCSGGDGVEILDLDEWIASNPVTRQWIEENISDWMETPAYSLWPDVEAIESIDEHQRDKVNQALTGRLAILGGSPGTGKTHCTAQVIRALLASGRVGLGEIGVGAPTGKAAVRLSEKLLEAGIDKRARTWHSLLGVGEQSETGGWSFRHGPGNPLPYKVLISDESSMLDLSLMRSIFAARQPGCHVLLVGDINQLPPVGNGAPLRDLIKAGVSYGELTEIKRNSGGIVEACALMRDQKPWAHITREPGTNLVAVDTGNQMDAMIAAIDRESSALSLDPVWGCQIIVAVNDRSKLSRKAVNEFLQDRLNPNPKIGNLKFRLRDKVVCLKNSFYQSCGDLSEGDEIQTNSQGEVYVANGELGLVEAIHEKKMVISLNSPSRWISVPLFRQKDSDGGESAGSANFDLGYALSCHRAQGSEWPVVLVLIDSYPGARMICDRAWVYTAISRAKQRCLLIGSTELAERFCRSQKMEQRKTFLAEQILQLQFSKELEAMEL